MSYERQSLRVGLLVLAAVVVFGISLLLLGEENNPFRPRDVYLIRLPDAEGLQSGNPVQISGVSVGLVEHIELPREADQPNLEIRIRVDRRYAGRVRQDSRASLRTIGLLGDKYIDVSPGSATAPALPPGGEIPEAAPSGVDQLVASGEDIAAHIVLISRALSRILDDIERGEGVVGDLMNAERAGGRSASESFFRILDSTEKIADKIARGHGTLGRLVNDRKLANDLERSVGRLEAVLVQAESGPGLLPSLLGDPTLEQRFAATLEHLERASGNLDAVAASLAEGQGAIPRLFTDEEYGAKLTADLEQVITKLDLLSTRLTEGEGTAARLINDPHLYQALNDVVVGVDDSRILRWLLRNRQRAGAKRRLAAEEAQQPPAGDQP